MTQRVGKAPPHERCRQCGHLFHGDKVCPEGGKCAKGKYEPPAVVKSEPLDDTDPRMPITSTEE